MVWVGLRTRSGVRVYVVVSGASAVESSAPHDGRTGERRRIRATWKQLRGSAGMPCGLEVCV